MRGGAEPAPPFLSELKEESTALENPAGAAILAVEHGSERLRRTLRTGVMHSDLGSSAKKG